MNDHILDTLDYDTDFFSNDAIKLLVKYTSIFHLTFVFYK